MITKKAKGFTLIELLVVIGILAVLATATALILNPAELLRQSRDSTRIADLGSLSAAIDIYLGDIKNPNMSPDASGRCTSGIVSKGTQGCTTDETREVDGNGWVTINFTAISAGSPIPRLPLDPNNGSEVCGTGADACFYQYMHNNTFKQYELNASMESVKFRNGTSTSNVESTDGGTNANAYEVGNKPGLNL